MYICMYIYKNNKNNMQNYTFLQKSTFSTN